MKKWIFILCVVFLSGCGLKGTTKVEFSQPLFFYPWSDGMGTKEEMCQLCLKGIYERPCNASDVSIQCNKTTNIYTSYCGANCDCEYSVSPAILVTTDKKGEDVKCQVYLNNNFVREFTSKGGTRIGDRITGGPTSVAPIRGMNVTKDEIIKVCCDGICSEKPYLKEC